MKAVFIFLLLPLACAGQSTWNYSSVYADVTVKDADYYKRLDDINQYNYDRNVSQCAKITALYEAGNYADAAYYAEKLRSRETMGFKWSMLAVSYAALKDYKRANKAFFEGLEYFEPSYKEKIQQVFIVEFGKLPERRSTAGLWVGLGIAGAATIYLATIVLIASL